MVAAVPDRPGHASSPKIYYLLDTYISALIAKNLKNIVSHGPCGREAEDSQNRPTDNSTAGTEPTQMRPPDQQLRSTKYIDAYKSKMA